MIRLRGARRGQMFVRAHNGKFLPLGVGKLTQKVGSLCTVEYFDAPHLDLILHEVDATDLSQVSLGEQTRIYHYNQTKRAWEIGRLLSFDEDTYFVRFPNGADRWLTENQLFVRWSRPIADPTDFLAAGVTESPRFSMGRHDFVRSMLSQRSVTLGMTAILSSAIEIEAHQVEVVRRILQDPIQRYLLADEVGLGKTIEAGILIRQCVLDSRAASKIVVLAPDSLIDQWKEELAGRFFLGPLLGVKIFVLPFSDHDQIKQLTPNADMLVVDEAHHLTRRADTRANATYSTIAAAAPNIERVLLLSATPALGNERGFLQMLHLLDSETYPLTDVEGFTNKVRNRQALGEIVAALTPDNVLYLDQTLDQLDAAFGGDLALKEHVANLRSISNTLPDEDDPALLDVINQLRAHISEVYRLHRRILRNRRSTVSGLTPDRSGAERISYRCETTARLSEDLDAWRVSALTGSAAGDAAQYLAAINWAVTLSPLSPPALSGDIAPGPLATIIQRLRDPQRFENRVAALVAGLSRLIKPKRQFVIFASDQSVADRLAAELAGRSALNVARHDPNSTKWESFKVDALQEILVCDQRAEEGLNLQGGQKIVIHFDLPLDPNRIEQRLGRADRYGSGDAIRSVVVCCEDNPLEATWADYLEHGLRIFERSVASLQYMIDDTVDTLNKRLFEEGAEAVKDLLAASTGNGNIIDREIKAIDHQDALDSLSAPSADTFERLVDFDDNWRKIDSCSSIWLENTLQFRRSVERADLSQQDEKVPLRYVYVTEQPHTLIPFDAFYSECSDAIDRSQTNIRIRAIKTYPSTFRRKTALSPDGRRQSTRLLRDGEPFMTGLWHLTQADDRGRSTAMWREMPSYNGRTLADLFFRFDFVVETDLSHALDVVAKSGGLTSAVEAALGRRGDIALPPHFESVWLSDDLEPVEDEATLRYLNMPYRPDSTSIEGRDFNLNAQRWQILKQLNVSQLIHWKEICSATRLQAEQLLRDKASFRQAIDAALLQAALSDTGRLALLKVRADRTSLAADAADWTREVELSRALLKGVGSPKISVDAVVACMLTNDAGLTTRLSKN